MLMRFSFCQDVLNPFDLEVVSLSFRDKPVDASTDADVCRNSLSAFRMYGSMTIVDCLGYL